MSKQTTITLKSVQTERIVKRVATLAFIGLRLMLNNSTKIPEIFSTAAGDIKQAWHDTANPKS
jgi:hypothetical protein